MNHAGSVFLVPMALMVGPQAGALEFQLRGSFATDFITGSPLRSISVSSQEDLFLMAFMDGSIFEVTRDLGTVTEVLPGPVPPQESTWVGYYGLLLIPSQNVFVSFTVGPGAYTFYTRTGKFAGSASPFTYGSFTGASFEEKEPIGELHALHYMGFIDHRRLPQMGIVDGLIQLPLSLTELAKQVGSRYKAPGFSGFTYLPAAGAYLISLVDGQVFAIRKTVKARFSSMVWESRVVAQADLKPLGPQVINDLAWDPVLERLYVADSSQSMVFELDLAPSGAPFHRGDPDGSGLVDLGDPVFLLDYLFLGGAEPSCLESADVNNDGELEITDAVYLLGFLFSGWAPPPSPGPPGGPCGREPDPWDSQIGLGCKIYPRC
jgi:hypothetical protein